MGPTPAADRPRHEANRGDGFGFVFFSGSGKLARLPSRSEVEPKLTVPRCGPYKNFDQI
jgi:hypothetical protein